MLVQANLQPWIWDNPFRPRKVAIGILGLEGVPIVWDAVGLEGIDGRFERYEMIVDGGMTWMENVFGREGR